MRKQTVPITVEIPLELAEFLSLHGNLLIQAVQNAVLEAKRAAKAEDFEWREDEAERKRKKRFVKLVRDGRAGHRALRKRLREDLDGFKGKERAAKRKVFIGELAAELSLFPDYLELAIRKHRNALRRRIGERRNLWILRYLIQGLTNSDIATRVSAHKSTVVLAVRNLRLEAKETGQSLEKLERFKSSQREQNTAGVPDDNVIQWADIKAARGGR